jgi:CTP:molybdopterin cytidylyltransferase MocA
VPSQVPTVGLLLAAGEGRRFGGPKALASDPDGTAWLLRSVEVLRTGGCEQVLVVLGAAAEEARALLAGLGDPADVEVVVAPDWSEGMGASLRAGLAALARQPVEAALVHLVDLPDVGAAVVARMLERASGPTALARATYSGAPGHPVLIGRDHWDEVVATSTGDRGARDHLATHAHEVVECGDLATGRDRDRQ